MGRKYDVRKIISKRSYTTEEIAEVFGVHVQTVRGWSKGGMQPIDDVSRPFLFEGSEVRRHLSEKRSKSRVTLKNGEFYCLKCRKAVHGVRVRCVDTRRQLGSGKVSVVLKGTCAGCGSVVNRFSAVGGGAKSLEKIETPSDLSAFENLPLFEKR